VANDLSAFNTEVWSRLLIKNLDQINVMLPHVNRDYEGQIKNLGDTVQVRTLGSVTMGAYTKDSTSISYEDLVPVLEAMTIADAQYFAFKVDSVDIAQNDLDALNLYAQRAAVAINNKIEAKILATYTAVHANNKIVAAGPGPITLTTSNIYSQLVEARARLSKFNVQPQGRWCVIDPDTTSLLLRSDEFVRATDLGDRVVQNGTVDGALASPGFIGRCAGFNIFESNQTPNTGGSKYLLFGDDMAIAYAAQLREVETLRLQVSFHTAVRGLLLHDTKVFAESSKHFGYIRGAA
jgi:hypothetical protein